MSSSSQGLLWECRGDGEEGGGRKGALSAIRPTHERYMSSQRREEVREHSERTTREARVLRGGGRTSQADFGLVHLVIKSPNLVEISVVAGRWKCLEEMWP